jgi:hypothetical protein
MSALVLRRAFVCLLVFVGVTAALTPVIGASDAVALAGVVAYAINARWRGRQIQRLERELRDVILQRLEREARETILQREASAQEEGCDDASFEA